jgi:hypothetical protein
MYLLFRQYARQQVCGVAASGMKDMTSLVVGRVEIVGAFIEVMAGDLDPDLFACVPTHGHRPNLDVDRNDLLGQKGF